MPHFTVTKVEDTEEAAASVPPEGETSLAEIKARTQHSDETGKYSTWELWELSGFFVRETVTNIPKTSCRWRENIVVKVFFNQLFHSLVYLITSFLTFWFVFPHNEFCVHYLQVKLNRWQCMKGVFKQKERHNKSQFMSNLEFTFCSDSLNCIWKST